MNTTQPPIVADVIRFVDYCKDFYNVHDGIYKIATEEEIEEAVYQYITQPNDIEILFDTTDRERVRQILQPKLKQL